MLKSREARRFANDKTAGSTRLQTSSRDQEVDFSETERKTLVGLCEEYTVGSWIFTRAVNSNLLGTIKWLREIGNEWEQGGVLYRAIATGNRVIIEWLIKNGHPMKAWDLDLAVRRGNTEMVDLLHSNNCPRPVDIFASAISLKMVKRLVSLGYRVSSYSYSIAVRHQRHEIVGWMRRHCMPLGR